MVKRELQFNDGKSQNLTPELSAAIRAVAADWRLGELKWMTDIFLQVARPYIGFSNTNAHREPAIPATFLGGLPEMPRDVEWPRQDGNYMPFIAQIDLSAIPQLPHHPLPTSGVLYFFGSAQGESPHVIWAECDTSVLERRTISESEIHPDWLGVRIYDQTLTTYVTHGASIALSPLLRAAENMDVDEHMLDYFVDAFSSEVELVISPLHFPKSRSPLKRECWGSSLGFFSLRDEVAFPSGLRRDDRETDTWVNLLRLPSQANMQWGDLSNLTFLIRAGDLADRNFHMVRSEWIDI